MSVIAAKVLPDKIVISCDSILIKDNLKKKFKKVIQLDDNTIIGGCGAVEELSLFFEYAFTHALVQPEQHDILKFMRDFSEWKASRFDLSSTIDNCYIIAVDGKLFEVDGLFVQEVDDYTAIGEAEAYALAALHLGHTPYEAVKACCDLCCYVSEPVLQFELKRCC